MVAGCAQGVPLQDRCHPLSHDHRESTAGSRAVSGCRSPQDPTSVCSFDDPAARSALGWQGARAGAVPIIGVHVPPLAAVGLRWWRSWTALGGSPAASWSVRADARAGSPRVGCRVAEGSCLMFHVEPFHVEPRTQGPAQACSAFAPSGAGRRSTHADAWQVTGGPGAGPPISVRGRRAREASLRGTTTPPAAGSTWNGESWLPAATLGRSVARLSRARDAMVRGEPHRTVDESLTWVGESPTSAAGCACSTCHRALLACDGEFIHRFARHLRTADPDG